MNSAGTSNIDLQSWWEVPSIAHFCSLFRVAFNLLDFDIEELEEALLTDGTELNGSSLLQELIVRLLSGCLGHNGISTSNYQMFLRRLFRTKCKEQGRENPFNTDIDFQFLPLRTKVEILHVLCDFRLDADDVIDVLKNLDSDSLRVHPLGYDENKSAYWYFYGTRLYREDYPKKRKKKKDHDKHKNKKKRKDDSSSEEDEEEEQAEEDTGWPPALGSWQVMCYTEDDWRKLAHSMAHSTCKEERALYQVLSEDFLPEIPRLFEEKERLQRKRLLENQPRRQSQRIEKLKSQKEPAVPSPSEPKPAGRPSRQERDKERAKRRKGRAEKNSRKRSFSLSNSESESSLSNVLPSGRQTNNSLASATGDVYIKPNSSQQLRNSLFKRTNEDLMTGLYKILDRVKAHDDAWPFRVPVDEKFAPRYYAVIARPMDLQTMEDKLDNAEYGSLGEFRADFQLIVDNCRQYNGSGNEYTDMVKRLQALFEACAERFLEVEPSSDDDLPQLRRNLPDGLDPDDDSLGSSLTPDDRLPSIMSERSRAHSLTSLSGESIVMSEDSSITMDEYMPGRGLRVEEYAPGRANRGREMVEHQSRRRKRRKGNRDRRTGLSEETETESSRSNSHSMSRSMSRSASPSISRSNSMVKHSRGPIRKERNILSRETSIDRSKDKIFKTAAQRRQKVDDDLKDRLDDDGERSRPKINYKENDTSESELLSDSSEDSYTANKNKVKAAATKKVKRPGIIKDIDMEKELEIVIEESLKDITRFLEDTPRFSDYSSNSNSPLHTPNYVVEEMAGMEGELRRRISAVNRPRDRFSNEIHRRRIYKEQLGIKRKREIQRTIDRLQPGKSKGNLLCKDKKTEETGEGNEAKPADNEVAAPQISLGKVLEADVMGFGIGDPAPSKKESEDEHTQDKLMIEEDPEIKDEKKLSPKVEEEEKKDEEKVEVKPVEPVEKKKEKPTPNLSAWFKAFGAPKPSNAPKKKPEPEEKVPRKEEEEDEKKMGIELPARRQRKTSTGSSVSERSSFSQEPMDGNSPRPSLDEPYQSPQQEIKQYHHSPINGTIKVGFYQDTCFPRGGSEKSSSPRDLPSCSPRDLPSVSPRTPYCSPRNTPIASRDYPSASPRTPYSRAPLLMSPRDYPVSPRTDYNNDMILRREYPLSASPRDYPNSVSPRGYISPASPREYPNPSSPREYPNPSGPREYPNPGSPREYPNPASPREYRAPQSPREYRPASPMDYPNPPTPMDYREPPPTPRDYREPPPTPRDYREPPPTPRDYREAPPTPRDYREPPPTPRDYREPPPTPRDYREPVSPREYHPPASPRDYPVPASPRDYPPPASPRDYPRPASPRDYPPPASPRDYPRPASPRDYPPPASPRDYPRPASPRDYPPPASPRDYPRPASPRDYPPPASPRDYPRPASPRDYPPPASPRVYPPPASPREYTTSVSPVPREPIPSPIPQERPLSRAEFPAYNPPRSPSTPIFAGVPSYPSHLYFEANKQVHEYRANLEKPTSVYPMKKRAYNEALSTSPKPSTEVFKSGGSFTPTRGAMEQERTFTPTPGRLPGPSTTTSIPIGLPHHPLQQHLIDQFAEENRRISSPFYPAETVYNKPQPAGMFGSQYIDRGDPNSSRSSTPLQPNSPNPVPINYSNVSDKESPLQPPQKESTIVNTSALNYGKVTTNDLHVPKVSTSSQIAYSSNRIEEMLHDKVSPQFNRSLPEIPHYPGQDLSKLQQLHQSEIQRYSQMANLGYNYHQMIQGKGPPVYNHPMQELMQSKGAYGNMMQSNLYGRPMGDMIPSKVAEREVPFTPRPPPKPVEKPPKKNRKKKTAETTTTAAFQQYMAPSSEPSAVPGSAFNFGPPTPQGLKEGYAPAYLEQFYDGSAAKPPFFLGRGAAAAYPPTHPFISQAQYQEYLLHHGVIPPTPGYPSPAAYLGIHSPMNRPSWL